MQEGLAQSSNRRAGPLYLYLPMQRFQYLSLFLLCALFLTTALAWAVVLYRTPTNELSVSFLDVGQGDATLITTPTGKQVLIDAGANRSVLRALARELPFWDRTIEVVVATHPDLDHIGGLPEVLNRYKVDTLIYHDDESNSGVMERALAIASARNVATHIAMRGDQLHFESGATLTILFPDRTLTEIDPNDASVIAQLRYGDTAFLFTGDASDAIEEYLVALDGENLESEVVKAGHHGSRTSTSPLFIGYTNPTYAVISSGGDNRYGHPHQEVLDTLERFSVETYRTDLLGTIHAISNGSSVRID